MYGYKSLYNDIIDRLPPLETPAGTVKPLDVPENVFDNGSNIDDVHSNDIDTDLDQDPVSSANKITESNNQAGLNAATSANDLNAETMQKAFEYYLQSIESLNTQNISSADKIMQMNEQAQINAYNRNLSYIDEYYPRLVKSLAKAGINPILMSSRGFGSPGNVSSAANISAPYITSPSSVHGFSANVANVDYDTARDVLVQMLRDKTDLQEADIYSTATIIASMFGFLSKLNG